MMTDPIADMLTRMRNALRTRRKKVKMPVSAEKVGIADALKREGYIDDFRKSASKPNEGQGPQGWLEIDLKYGPEGEDVISSITRESKPGRRLYTKCDDIPLVLNGLGITILSTSKGIMSGREARAAKLGGEILCKVH
jgi:small subunit ribosomal protein S8